MLILRILITLLAGLCFFNRAYCASEGESHELFGKLSKEDQDLLERHKKGMRDLLEEWDRQEAIRIAPIKKGKEEFSKIVAKDPYLLEDDFVQMFDYGTNKLDEAAMKNLSATRKDWLTRHPGARAEDYWYYREHESELPKRITDRTKWLTKHKEARPEDFHEFDSWNDEELHRYFTDRNTWLAQNPGKKSRDYFEEVWQPQEHRRRLSSFPS